jgi:hypothetical protein
MRRLLWAAWLGTFLLVLGSHAAIAQGTTSGSTAQATPKTESTKKPQVTTAALNVDGEWQGTTSNGREFALNIKQGVVVLFRLAYGIPSQGCFIVPELNGKVEVSWSETSKYAPRLVGRMLNASRDFSDRSPNINAELHYALRGTFSSKAAYSGIVTFQAVSARCVARSQVKVTANRVPDGTLATGASMPPLARTSSAAPPVMAASPALETHPSPSAPAFAGPVNGAWEGVLDDRQKLRFRISGDTLTHFSLDYVLSASGCLDIPDLRGTDVPEFSVQPLNGRGEITAFGTLPMPSRRWSGIAYSIGVRFTSNDAGQATLGFHADPSLRTRDFGTLSACKKLLSSTFPVRRIEERQEK